MPICFSYNKINMCICQRTCKRYSNLSFLLSSIFSLSTFLIELFFTLLFWHCEIRAIRYCGNIKTTDIKKLKKKRSCLQDLKNCIYFEIYNTYTEKCTTCKCEPQWIGKLLPCQEIEHYQYPKLYLCTSKYFSVLPSQRLHILSVNTVV